MTATLIRSGYLALRNMFVIVSGQMLSRNDAIAAYTIEASWSAAVPTGGHGRGAAGSTSSRSTIRSHFPSWGPTQTQGSLWGAGKVHFLSSGSQSGPMPACASAAHARSRLMAAHCRSCCERRQESFVVASASPRACILDATCTTAAVWPRQAKLPKKFSVASVLQAASSLSAPAFILRCGAQPRLQIGS